MRKIDHGYNITLDKKKHQYYVNGEKVRSLHQKVTKSQKRFYGTRFTNFGHDLHENINKMLLGHQITEDRNYMKLFLNQFIKWYKQIKPRMVSTEEMLYNQKDDYCGTPDYIGYINGVPFIIDWKTTHIKGFDDSTKVPANRRNSAQVYMYKKLVEANYCDYDRKSLRYAILYISSECTSFREVDFQEAFKRKSKKNKPLDYLPVV